VILHLHAVTKLLQLIDFAVVFISEVLSFIFWGLGIGSKVISSRSGHVASDLPTLCDLASLTLLALLAGFADHGDLALVLITLLLIKAAILIHQVLVLGLSTISFFAVSCIELLLCSPYRLPF